MLTDLERRVTQRKGPSTLAQARTGARMTWRCFLWRVAQGSRHNGASAEGLADQLAAPRPALWQLRQRERPLSPLVSDTPAWWRARHAPNALLRRSDHER